LLEAEPCRTPRSLIWDGVHKYTYDAWNRLARIEKAYREPNGTPSGGGLVAAYTVATMEYDGTHRRTVKAVQNSADLDCTYHFYYDASWRLLETRNGSEQVIQQHVWGQMYIDELVQVANNGDIIGDEEFDPDDPDHDFRGYYAQHDANFNVIGIVNAQGALVERYEYTPYGHRTVYFSPGSNDPTCHAATAISRRVMSSGTIQPWGVNTIGHQGLRHDEATHHVQNRFRVLHPGAERFLQKDWLGYVDGMSPYAYVGINPITRVDPYGLKYRPLPNAPTILVRHEDGSFQVGIYVQKWTSRTVCVGSGMGMGIPYSSTGTWDTVGVLMANPVSSSDPCRKLTECEIKKAVENTARLLANELADTNRVESAYAIVQGIEFAGNFVPFFDASDKAILQGDFEGAAWSAAVEGGIMLVTAGAGKAVKSARCVIRRADDAPVVIGENMRRVGKHAKDIDGVTITDWLNGRTWTPELNQQFIEEMKRQGRHFVDIGPDFGRRLKHKMGIPDGAPPSSIYGCERKQLLDYDNYTPVYSRTGKFSGDAPYLTPVDL